MDQVIEGLKANKAKAVTIINQANKNKEDLLSLVPQEAKEKIKGLKTQNADSLKSYEQELQNENNAKSEEIIRETKQILSSQKENADKHIDELVNILYDLVVNVEA